MLTAEQIKENWEKFLMFIETQIAPPRNQKLLEFYKKHDNRFAMMPASFKIQYHNCFPGGYIDHVNRVIQGSMFLYNTWKQMGADMTTFTLEELIFSAVNHDLGKFGTEEEEAYIEQTDEWRRNKLNEQYMFNNKIEFMSVPDRSLYLLMSNGIEFSKNEMLAIKLHDGVYDEANKPYLQNWLPEQKPRTSLVYILHHADIMASRIEFEKEWLPKFKENDKSQETNSVNFKNSPNTTANNANQVKFDKKQKALNSVLGDNLILKNFFK